MEKKPNFIVINVLDYENYSDCHIKGSISIPVNKIDEIKKIVDKDAQIVAYCAHYKCGISAEARKKLLEMGYKNVLLYEGGIAQWHQKGFPTEGACKKEFLSEIVQKPQREKEAHEITAQELKDKMG